jgi:hypothetical protein
MKDVEGLSKTQADLLNKDFERARQEEARNKQRPNSQDRRPSQNQTDPSLQGAQEAAAAQENLRKELSRINDSLKQMTGKPQPGLGEANDAMGEARDDLRVGAWQSGVEQQSKALSKLEESTQQAQQDLMEAMFKQGMGGIMNQPGTPQFHFGQGSRGRAGGNNSDLDVPTGPDPESMASRVRSILEEIRSRAADRTRPAEEQDYLKRLMKQF